MEDLAEVREARTAPLRRLADTPAKLAHRPRNQGDQNGRSQRHSPIDDGENEHERDEAEQLTEELGHPIGESAAHLFDIADHGRHHAAHRILLEEANRLLHHLAVHLIPQIGDAGEADILDQRAAEIFCETFHQEQKNHGDGKHRPDVVNARRNERIQVDHVPGAGNTEQLKLLDGGSRVQNDIERRPYGEGDQEVD